MVAKLKAFSEVGSQASRRQKIVDMVHSRSVMDRSQFQFDVFTLSGIATILVHDLQPCPE